MSENTGITVGNGLKSVLENNKEVTYKTYELDKLKSNFPQYFDKDGKFDFDKFKNALNEENAEYSDEPFSSKESYSLNFVGKKFAQIQCGQDTTTVITPDLEHNNKPENIDSENIYIKGDNLDAIKHLLKSYRGAIKCIYIDPPYNTGTDNFAYPDNYKYDIPTLIKMGLSEDEAERVERLYGKATHSAWLTFMMPRLALARDLLTDDGVIFVSIDENELENLIGLCKKDIFHDANIDFLIWRKNGKQGNTKKINRFKTTHEYIVVLYKDRDRTRIGKVKLLPNWKGVKTNPDNDPRGNWESGVLSRDEEHSDVNSENYYSITLPSGRIITREFYYTLDEFNEFLKQNKIYFPKDGDGIPRLKIFENEEQFYYFDTIIDEMGTFTSAKENLENLLGKKDIFDTPKPVKMIKEFIRTTTLENSYVLDFFSGSATTAHAVMQLNAEEDNGKRKYIMVQIQEKLAESKEAYKQGYRTICDIGIDRIKKAAKKIKEETNADIDYGFKIYELNNPSNDTLDKIESFDASLNKLYPADFRDCFKFNNIAGEETILQTWKVQDGYGFTTKHEEIYLDGCAAYQVEKTLYLINPTQNDFIKPLIEKFENELSKINKVVVFGYSYTFTQMQSLNVNIKNYNDAIKDTKSEITIEVRY